MRHPGPAAATGLLLTHSVLTQAATFIIRPGVTYRALELDVPGAWLGTLGASFAVPALLLALPAGHVVDRLGERWVLLLGSVLTAGSALILLLSSGLLPLVVATAVLGMGHLSCVVSQQALVANRAGASTTVSAFGYYTFAASLGQAVGPAMLAMLPETQNLPDTRAVFLSGGTIAVLMVATAVVLPHRAALLAAGRTRGTSVMAMLRLPGLARAILVSSLVLAAIDVTVVYLPALGPERGLSASFIGLLLTLRALASMSTRLLLGTLTRAVGANRLMWVSVLVGALALGAAALPLPPWLLVTAMVVAGLGLGAGQPLAMSWLAVVAPTGQRGRAMSLRLTGNRLAQVAIPSLAGLVAAGAGASGVLAATAATLVLAATAAPRSGAQEPGAPSPSGGDP